MADLGGAQGARAPPPWAPKFFQFHAVFRNIWQNRMLAPPPPRGNPGSAAGEDQYDWQVKDAVRSTAFEGLIEADPNID